jgi:predicted XRE-type DNA-binding protein
MAPIRKNRSPRLNEQLAAYIKWLWLHTPLNQAQISACLGAINQGRVSEVVNGHRFADVNPQRFEGWS